MEPVSAIEWRWPRGFILERRRQMDSMWLLFIEGRCRGSVGGHGESFAVGAGDSVFVPHGVEHEFAMAPRSTGRIIAVHFHARVFGGADLLSLVGFPSLVGRLRGGRHFEIARDLCREYAVKPPAWRESMAAGVWRVLLSVMRCSASSFHSRGDVQATDDIARVMPAMEVVEERLGEPELSVGDLAAAIFLSEVQFRKIFRRATGTTPAKFIQRRRVEAARTMLRSTDDTVESIAFACGFREAGFFHRVFRNWTGTTPGRYRSLNEV
jgi:AraC-like DNA-binding protein